MILKVLLFSSHCWAAAACCHHCMLPSWPSWGLGKPQGSSAPLHQHELMLECSVPAACEVVGPGLAMPWIALMQDKEVEMRLFSYVVDLWWLGILTSVQASSHADDQLKKKKKETWWLLLDCMGRLWVRPELACPSLMALWPSWVLSKPFFLKMDKFFWCCSCKTRTWHLTQNFSCCPGTRLLDFQRTM